jgi:hypothetical protein
MERVLPFLSVTLSGPLAVADPRSGPMEDIRSHVSRLGRLKIRFHYVAGNQQYGAVSKWSGGSGSTDVDGQWSPAFYVGRVEPLARKKALTVNVAIRPTVSAIGSDVGGVCKKTYGEVSCD